MFVEPEPTHDAICSQQNATHFVESEKGSNEDAESINISRQRRDADGASFETFERILKELYREYTFDFAARESGVDAKTIEEIAKLVATAGTKLSSHNWRSVTSGVSHGWSVARALFMLNAFLGAVANEGGVFPTAWN